MLSTHLWTFSVIAGDSRNHCSNASWLRTIRVSLTDDEIDAILEQEHRRVDAAESVAVGQHSCQPDALAERSRRVGLRHEGDAVALAPAKNDRVEEQPPGHVIGIEEVGVRASVDERENAERVLDVASLEEEVLLAGLEVRVRADSRAARIRSRSSSASCV